MGRFDRKKTKKKNASMQKEVTTKEEVAIYLVQAHKETLNIETWFKNPSNMQGGRNPNFQSLSDDLVAKFQLYQKRILTGKNVDFVEYHRLLIITEMYRKILVRIFLKKKDYAPETDKRKFENFIVNVLTLALNSNTSWDSGKMEKTFISEANRAGFKASKLQDILNLLVN